MSLANDFIKGKQGNKQTKTKQNKTKQANDIFYCLNSYEETQLWKIQKNIVWAQ